jgi:hypothetical protein
MNQAISVIEHVYQKMNIFVDVVTLRNVYQCSQNPYPHLHFYISYLMYWISESGAGLQQL